MTIEMHIPVIDDQVLYATHDVACAVCGTKKAVYNCNTAVFQPCWTCQSKGFKVRFKKRWLWKDA